MNTNDLPWNQEAEAAVLGVILRGEASLDEVRRDLGLEDFYGLHHKAIYAAIVELAKRGVGTDLVTTYDALRSGPGTPSVDATYLAGLCEAAPVSSHLSHYVSIVKRDSGRRKYLQAVERFVASQNDSQSNGTGAAVEQLIQELGRIHGLAQEAKGHRGCSLRPIEPSWSPLVPRRDLRQHHRGSPR